MKAEAEQEGLYFNTATLARFMRANYGADAAKEAKRSVSGRLSLRSSAPNQVFVAQRSGHERAVVVERKVSRFRQPVLNLPMR